MRALLFETLTGQPVTDLEILTCSYDTGVLAPDKISLTVPAYTPRALATDLRGLLLPRRVGVALQYDDGWVPAAGVLMTPPKAVEDEDGKHAYELELWGPERLFEGRYVRKHPGWPLTDADGAPTGVYDLSVTGVEYGTIMKRLIQESMLWPGGQLPLAFEADRPGTRERTYPAVDGKQLLEALDDLTELLGGVEYDLVPRISDTDMVSWALVTGTDQDRIITSPVSPSWRLGGPEPDLSHYVRETSADGMADRAVFMGGKDDDRVLAARATTSALTDAGYPTWEIWDTSHTSVSQLSTLQAWADGAVTTAPRELLSFDVRRHRAIGLRHGDYVDITAQDHWDMPDGIYERRVLSVGGTDDEDWLSITIAGELVHA